MAASDTYTKQRIRFVELPFIRRTDARHLDPQTASLASRASRITGIARITSNDVQLILALTN